MARMDASTAELPPVEFWRTRSFWLAIATAAAPIAASLNLDLGESETIADAALAVVSLITLAMTYHERANPSRRVVARRPG